MRVTPVVLTEIMLHGVTLTQSLTIHQHKKELAQEIKTECKYKNFLAVRKEYTSQR